MGDQNIYKNFVLRGAEEGDEHYIQQLMDIFNDPVMKARLPAVQDHKWNDNHNCYHYAANIWLSEMFQTCALGSVPGELALLQGYENSKALLKELLKRNEEYGKLRSAEDLELWLASILKGIRSDGLACLGEYDNCGGAKGAPILLFIGQPNDVYDYHLVSVRQDDDGGVVLADKLFKGSPQIYETAKALLDSNALRNYPLFAGVFDRPPKMPHEAITSPTAPQI